MIALLLATALAVPLPLDLAYSRREVHQQVIGTVSPDGRWLAYEIRTPQTGMTTLPNGFPSVYFGVNLWLGSTDGSEPRAICPKGPCWRGSFSPDSRQLAYYSNEDGTPSVWVCDVSSGAKRRLADIRPRLESDRAVWSPDGKTLYVRGPRAAGAKPPAAGEKAGPSVAVFRTHDAPPQEDVNAMFRGDAAPIVAIDVGIDVARGASRVVVPQDAEVRAAVIRLSPDGQWISYLSVPSVKEAAADDWYESLVIVPASGGKPVAVFRDIRIPDDGSRDGTYRWTPDSKRIVYSKAGDLWIASLDDASHPRRLGESLGTITGSPLYLTRDGSAAIVSVESGEKKVYDFMPYTVIAVVPLDGSAARKLDVHAVPTAWQPSSGSLVAMRGHEVVEVDLNSGKVQSLGNTGRVTPAGVANNMLVARYENLTTPGDYYLFDRSMKIVRRLSHAEPRLDAITVGPMEAFETTIGGQPVQSHIFLPAGTKRGDKLPAIVYFYSGAQLSSHADDFGGGAPTTIPVQIFASRGYAVLFCDVPLSPPGKGNPVQEMTEAVVAQVEHAAALEYVDPHRVAILGQSYGGYSTAAIITRSNAFRAAIAIDGVYDLPGNYGSDDDIAWSETGQGRMGTHPWAALDRYIANSPYYQADKIHTPLLLIHGEKDNACPVLEARKMFNAIKRLGGDAELAIYAGEGHVPAFWALANSMDATERMLAFLDAYLK